MVAGSSYPAHSLGMPVPIEPPPPARSPQQKPGVSNCQAPATHSGVASARPHYSRRKGYGLAHVADRRRGSTESTIFRVGSISKVFTAMAIVQLADRGLLEHLHGSVAPDGRARGARHREHVPLDGDTLRLAVQPSRLRPRNPTLLTVLMSQCI